MCVCGALRARVSGAAAAAAAAATQAGSVLVWAMLRVDSRTVIDEKINRYVRNLMDGGPGATIVRIMKEFVKVLPTVQVCAVCGRACWRVRVDVC